MIYVVFGDEYVFEYTTADDSYPSTFVVANRQEYINK